MKTPIQDRRMVFHLPFEIDKNRISASQIRPLKMLQAFKTLGYQVFEVTGGIKERKKKLVLLKGALSDGQQFDFCYSESSTMPTLLTEDHHLPTAPFLEIKLFSLLKKNGIPVGLFYRDIYWKFDSYKENVNAFKRSFASFFYHVDFWIYRKYVDIVYLPTLSMAKHLPQNLAEKSLALHPGADIRENEQAPATVNSEKPLTFIYVGGVLPPHYDLQPLFHIAQKYSNLRFKIICRKEEWEVVKGKYSISENVSILHVSGEQLTKEYQEADIFLNIREPDEYLHFAMPMKIFEALQETKPIITTNLHEIAQLVSSNGLGWVIYKNEDFERLIADLEKDRSLYEGAVKNISKFIERNTWISRAEQVKHNLIHENNHSNRS